MVLSDFSRRGPWNQEHGHVLRLTARQEKMSGSTKLQAQRNTASGIMEQSLTPSVFEGAGGHMTRGAGSRDRKARRHEQSCGGRTERTKCPSR